MAEDIVKRRRVVEEVLNKTNPEQQKKMLRECLYALTRPELKRMLWLFAREMAGFDRLIRELGGRTVVPYIMDD